MLPLDIPQYLPTLAKPSMKAPTGNSGGGGGGGGASLGVDALVQLLRACLAEGTLEQCLNLDLELSDAGGGLLIRAEINLGDAARRSRGIPPDRSTRSPEALLPD
jgi:hypothetical protein